MRCFLKDFKPAAFALCVIFIVIFILGEAFVIVSARHTHDTDGHDGCCAVCERVMSVEKLLRQLSTVAAVAVAPLAFCRADTGRGLPCRPWARVQTLVALKVRMNN